MISIIGHFASGLLEPAAIKGHHILPMARPFPWGVHATEFYAGAPAKREKRREGLLRS
jgi:hypothetical protein